ncbi:MAG: glycine cleavage system protein [Rhodocyclaceae bacterium]|nr:glycine cleavage system protein [Rhodocyclaceae bacterium]
MAHKPFRGAIPDDRLYCSRHDMWVQEKDGEVLIGATSFGIFLAGEIIAFTAKPNGAEVEIHRGMGTVECRKTVLAVHSPLSFKLVEGNEVAESRPKLINIDPYGTGWMARGQAMAWLAERERLLDAAAYRLHVLSVEPGARFDD